MLLCAAIIEAEKLITGNPNVDMDNTKVIYPFETALGT
jgi:hypothetical protein